MGFCDGTVPMEASNYVTNMNVTAKVNEAETYLSMGLHEESLLVYEQILSAENVLDESARQTIATKISAIKGIINNLEQNECTPVLPKDKGIAFVKKALSVTDEMPEILNCAVALMEFGFYKEALCEYERLLRKNYDC